MNASQKKAFSALILVFFFWGFVAAGNDILIPVFKNALNLSQLQSQMVSFAFYVAYTVGSLLYIFISKYRKQDIIESIGYRKGLALGLVISALGTGLFFPAAQYYQSAKEAHDEKLTDYFLRMGMMYQGQLTLDYADANEHTRITLEEEFDHAKGITFIIFITGLFIVGIGFSLQQTVANPLAIILGNPSEGSQRLSLAGGINNIGTTIGPLIVAFAIFGKVGAHSDIDVSAVKIPYLILGLSFLAAAYFFVKSSIPDHIASTDQAEQEAGKENRSVFSYPQLYLGMIAIFVYVGVEVSTASNLPEFMKQKLGVKEDQVAPFVSLFWASLMIGRWTSAGLVFAKTEMQKMLFRLALPYGAFGVFLLVNWIAGHELHPFYPYAAIIPILIIGDMLSKGNPSRQLLIYSLLGIAALVVGIMGTEMVSVYAFISVGLFCSTLWPCIYTLAIAGLGNKTNEGSGYLIMMIMGGGFISVLQGALSSDHILGIQGGYWVGVACFAYLAFYAWKVNNSLKAQGIALDGMSAGGH